MPEDKFPIRIFDNQLCIAPDWLWEVIDKAGLDKIETPVVDSCSHRETNV